MFQCMKIGESIYEGVVEPYHKKPTRADTNHSVNIRHKRGEAALSLTFPVKGEIARKRRKRHVDIQTGKSKTCRIHSP